MERLHHGLLTKRGKTVGNKLYRQSLSRTNVLRRLPFFKGTDRMDIFFAVGILLDVTVVLIALLPMIQGFRKGFKRKLLSLVALAVSALVAYVVSGLFAPQIYRAFLKDKTTDICVSAAESIDPVSIAKQALAEKGLDIPTERVREIISQADTDQLQAIRQAAAEYGVDEQRAAAIAEQFSGLLPEKTAAILKEQVPQAARAITSGVFSDEQITDALRTLSESPETAGEYVEENYAAPLITSAVETLMYAVCFAAMQFIMLLMFMLFGYDLKKSADSNGDRAAGLMLGLVEAASELLVMCVVVTGIINSSQGMLDISMVKSVLFVPIYKFIY